ncbi:MAG: hypothetical protein A3F74_07270 [Betaproteobacteria bacterium RIFCSPLOWO2_12_FULL_62_58]|nr:MAG: hypothetical protein A3F74_07270 [Betaproteobacteria bacterium RIFCSPLOWO2_12_FULL_62_58]
MHASEDRLRALLLRGLAGDASAERLPDRQRLPILLMKLEGLSVVEAAARTGMSESTVKVGVHRGLKALAAMIRRER